METTLSANECDHISKVVEFGYQLEDGKLNQYVKVFGCTKCDVTSSEPLYDLSDNFKSEVDHSNCDHNPCFGCKAKGLQMNAGDAKGSIISGGMTQKAWDKELDLYKQARKQGIQPDSTRTKDIQKAMDLSNQHGKAYDGGSPTKGIYDGSK